MKLKFQVQGMTCAACSARVEKVTGAVPGVEKAEVNLLAGTMTVEAADESVVSGIVKAVTDAGYSASAAGAKIEKQEHSKQEDSLKEMKNRIIGSGVFLIVLMYFTMGHMIGIPAPHWYHGTENAMVAVLLQFLCAVGMGYVCGCLYPVSFMPDALRNAAGFLPAGAALEFMTKGLLEQSAAVSGAVIIAYALVFWLGAAWVRRRRLV